MRTRRCLSASVSSVVFGALLASAPIAFPALAVALTGCSSGAPDPGEASSELASKKLPLDPPVRSGFYQRGGRTFFVHVEKVPDWDKRKEQSNHAPYDYYFTNWWRGRVFETGRGCHPVLMDTFTDVICEYGWGSHLGGCWFDHDRQDGAAAVTVLAHERWDDKDDDGSLTWSGPVLSWMREATPIEFRYFSQINTSQTCEVSCRSAPAPPPRAEPTMPPQPSPCDFRAGQCSWQCPLVLNLAGGDTIGFIGKEVSFDLNGLGAHPLDWVEPQYPFLALDINHNDAIDDGTELFGTATLLNLSKKRAENGFDALAQHDDNHDRKIDKDDAVYHRLLLWFDRNSDGKSSPDELTPLVFSGVERIQLEARPLAPPTSPTTAFIGLLASFEENACSYKVPMMVADVWFPTK